MKNYNESRIISVQYLIFLEFRRHSFSITLFYQQINIENTTICAKYVGPKKINKSNYNPLKYWCSSWYFKFQ